MPDRQSLHEVLCGLLESRNVYFQPREDVQMKYPAIVYALNDINSLYANDGVYLSGRQYSVTFITKDPDSEQIDKIAALPTCRFNRHYKADNLNHYVYTLHY